MRKQFGGVELRRHRRRSGGVRHHGWRREGGEMWGGDAKRRSDLPMGFIGRRRIPGATRKTNNWMGPNLA